MPCEARDVRQQLIQVGQDVRQVRVHERQVRSQLVEPRDEEVHVRQEPRQVRLVVGLELDCPVATHLVSDLVHHIAGQFIARFAASAQVLQRDLALDTRIRDEVIEVVEEHTAVLREHVQVQEDVWEVRLDLIHAVHDAVQVWLHLPEVGVQDANDAGDVWPEDREARVDGRDVWQDPIVVRQDRPQVRGSLDQPSHHIHASERLVHQPAPGVLGVRHAAEEDTDGIVGNHLCCHLQRAPTQRIVGFVDATALGHLDQWLDDRHRVGVELDLHHLGSVVAAVLLEHLDNAPRIEHIAQDLHVQALLLPILPTAHQQRGVPVDELQGLLARRDLRETRQHLSNALRVHQEGGGVHLDDLQNLLLGDPESLHQFGPPPTHLRARQRLAEELLLLHSHGVLAADCPPSPRRVLVTSHIDALRNYHQLLLRLDALLLGPRGGHRRSRSDRGGAQQRLGLQAHHHLAQRRERRRRLSTRGSRDVVGRASLDALEVLQHGVHHRLQLDGAGAARARTGGPLSRPLTSHATSTSRSRGASQSTGWQCAAHGGSLAGLVGRMGLRLLLLFGVFLLHEVADGLHVLHQRRGNAPFHWCHGQEPVRLALDCKSEPCHVLAFWCAALQRLHTPDTLVVHKVALFPWHVLHGDVQDRDAVRCDGEGPWEDTAPQLQATAHGPHLRARHLRGAHVVAGDTFLGQPLRVQPNV
mmetsp:Transcript_68896/g.177529  ORF Transcript_68896/g.177529 Transcript_68896/m.177529 type:complete len:699 (+) Transcript_68896:765-2861(+)